MAPLVDEDGKITRRNFRRTGYTTVGDAQSDLDKVRQILDLAGDDDDAYQRVTDLLVEVAKDRRAPIPDVAEVRRRLGVGVELNGQMTVAELLTKWAASKKTRDNTTRGYLSHIRVHLVPHLGHLRADRCTEDHVVSMFDRIADENEVILAENQARREQLARCTRWEARRPEGVRARGPGCRAGQARRDAAVPPHHRTDDPAADPRDAARRATTRPWPGASPRSTPPSTWR